MKTIYEMIDELNALRIKNGKNARKFCGSSKTAVQCMIDNERRAVVETEVVETEVVETEVVETEVVETEVKKETVKTKVLNLIKDGKNTIEIIAETLNISRKNVSSNLTYLRRDLVKEGLTLVSKRINGQTIVTLVAA